MRLTKEHIGKFVMLGGTEPIRRVVFVSEGFAWLKDGAFNSIWNCEGDYKIVEPKKKPSERIDELLKDRLDTYGTYDSIRFDTIKMFLDEQAEASK